MIAPSRETAENSLPRETSTEREARVQHTARQWLADNCPYQYYFRNVEIQFHKGVLTLHGRVHSFYLKQVLQSVLGELPEIVRVDNHVEVVSSVGLSSVKPE